MSLDLYFRYRVERKSIHHGTGIYVRDGGEIKELKTKEEVMSAYPGMRNGDIVEEFEVDESDAWHRNITHNLGEMADHIPTGSSTLYYYLWRPEELGFTTLCDTYLRDIEKGYKYMKEHEEELKIYNSPNGWGTYEGLCNFVEDLIESGKKINYKDEEVDIISDR